MPKKLFRRLIPDAKNVKSHTSLAFLGALLHDPYLFHLNRHSVSLAFLVGVFCAFLPLPGQMAIAAIIALIVKCNLPIAVTLVWISNPITIPPLFFCCYRLGIWLLQVPSQDFTIELSWYWATHTLVNIWKPLIVGALVCGSFFSVIAYLSIRIFWRYYVGTAWRKRRQRAREEG